MSEKIMTKKNANTITCVWIFSLDRGSDSIAIESDTKCARRHTHQSELANAVCTDHLWGLITN